MENPTTIPVLQIGGLEAEKVKTNVDILYKSSNFSYLQIINHLRDLDLST